MRSDNLICYQLGIVCTRGLTKRFSTWSGKFLQLGCMKHDKMQKRKIIYNDSN